ncbi:hypothetical protein [Delftia tsuruhatensis]|uniref:hypothetical protein n=1 Tax=Delftia tsuruhatensis TaxID=180282 RepID=UPI001F436D59|nr:hypothetical protein [Delftia tsuruhatensis]
MLGSAFVTLKGMAQSRNADLHDIAVMHATSLASAMHANRRFWADTAISPCFSTGGGRVRGCDYLAVPSPAPECGACTAQARAVADLGAWRDRLLAALPQARLDVQCLDSAAEAADSQAASDMTRSCSIRVAWQGPADGRRQDVAGQNTYMIRVRP